MKKPLFAAALFVCLVLAGFVSIKVYEVVRTDYGKHAEITFPAEYDESMLDYYISKLPDGYKTDAINIRENVMEAHYTDGNGAILLFLQAPAQNYALDNETEQETIRLSNGNTAYLSDKGGIINIFWRDEETYLSITAQLDRETMIEVANSVVHR